MPKPSTSFGFAYAVDPGIIRTTDNLGLPAVNSAIYARLVEGGSVSKVGLRVSTQGGNISVGAYRNLGSGRNAVPGARIATSGSLVCPAAGYVEIPFATPVRLRAGDWLAISADNVTATFSSLLAAGSDFPFGNGRQYRQATAHPLPATPSGLVATVGYTLVLIGVR